jgi:hypothetical protein
MTDGHDKPKPTPKPFKLASEEVEALRKRAMLSAQAAGWARGEDGLLRKPKSKQKEPTEKR